MHFWKFDSRPDFFLIINILMICFWQKIIIESEHSQLLDFIGWHNLLFHLLKNWIQKLTFLLHNKAIKLGTDYLKNSLLVFEEIDGYVFIIVAESAKKGFGNNDLVKVRAFLSKFIKKDKKLFFL